MNFQEDKKKQLEREDKSDKGNWDEKIAKLCKKINSRKEYYTTSSCSGRVILIKDEERKERGLFLFRTHKKISLKKLKEELIKAGKLNVDINFKQEQCILHVACFDVASAQKLIDSAKFTGWKHSGIIASSDRIVCELRSTERIEFLIISKGRLLVGDGFLRVLVREANRKLERTWEKISRLERLI